MPRYRVKFTKTQTIVSTVEKEIEIPTDDSAKAHTYVEVACGLENSNPSSPLYYAYWLSEPTPETLAIEVERLPDEIAAEAASDAA